MSIKKIITGLTLALLLSSGVASADYNSANNNGVILFIHRFIHK